MELSIKKPPALRVQYQGPGEKSPMRNKSIITYSLAFCKGVF